MDYNTSQKRNGWWNKRSKVEKCCIVLLALSSVTIVYLASNLFMKFPNKNELNDKVCTTDKCIIRAAEILQKIDRKVDPCDDFYKFACGNFIKNTEIPDDRRLITTVSKVSQKITSNLRNILETPIKPTDQKYVKLVKTVYKMCMNVTKMENEGLKYFKIKFQEFGGWPVLQSEQWNERNFDWKKLLYRFRQISWRQNMFFNLYIGENIYNSSRLILTVTQPCLDYTTLKKGMNDSLVQARFNYMVSLATLFGASHLAATEQMREVIEFEMDLAKIIVPRNESGNSSVHYKLVTIRQLQNNFTTIPWLQFINVYLSPVDKLTSDDVVNLGFSGFFKKMETLLQTTKRRTLANYMFLTIVRDYVYFLPEDFRKTKREYFTKITGEQAKPRWQFCVSLVQSVGIASSTFYLRNFFNISLQREVTDLVLDLKSSFIETLKQNSWMDRKTKKNALLKAEKMTSIIGFPYEVLNDDIINNYYNELEINEDNLYLDVIFNITRFYNTLRIKSLKEPVDKNDWRDFAPVLDFVNAFYRHAKNSIGLPAAIIQNPFYSPDMPQYLNYGSLGSMVGHEMTHGFDTFGRKYDQDGNWLDWWEPETNRTFTKKTQCLVEQYSNFTIPNTDLNLNGLNTLSEDIADNGGIKIAYRGYLKWLERKKADEQTLPGLRYTSKQMFWIAAAHTWCGKYKKEYLKEKIIHDNHSPNYFRVVIPFMNSDYFARDFNCPLGSYMNPKYKCRVW